MDSVYFRLRRSARARAATEQTSAAGTIPVLPPWGALERAGKGLLAAECQIPPAEVRGGRTKVIRLRLCEVGAGDHRHRLCLKAAKVGGTRGARCPPPLAELSGNMRGKVMTMDVMASQSAVHWTIAPGLAMGCGAHGQA
jgi:hypothetical protein